MHVALRPVAWEDVAVFYAHQADPLAAALAAFPSRDRAAHDEHWRKILTDPACLTRTILADGAVAGNIGSWLALPDERDVGYWIGRPYWGRGIATAALALFLQELTERPIHAHVAKHNARSIRVLEKCGFVRVRDGEDELMLALRG